MNKEVLGSLILSFPSSQNMMGKKLTIWKPSCSILDLKVWYYSFIGCELRAAIATQFDRKFIYYILLLKFNHHLDPLFKIESSFVNKSNEDNSLDIFEMVTYTHKLIKEHVNKKLMIFHKFQMDGKDIKCLLEWWKKHESMLVFFSRQLLGIINSQIEIERIFFLIHIFINLTKC